MTPEGFVFINKRQANQLQMSRLVGSQPQLQTQELRVFVEAHSVQAKLGAVEESRIPQQGQFLLRGFPANLWVLFKSWGIPKSPWVSILTWSDWCSKKGTVGFISMYNLTIIIHHLTSSNNPFFFYSHIFDGYSCYQPQRMEKVVPPPWSPEVFFVKSGGLARAASQLSSIRSSRCAWRHCEWGGSMKNGDLIWYELIYIDMMYDIWIGISIDIISNWYHIKHHTSIIWYELIYIDIHLIWIWYDVWCMMFDVWCLMYDMI